MANGIRWTLAVAAALTMMSCSASKGADPDSGADAGADPDAGAGTVEDRARDKLRACFGTGEACLDNPSPGTPCLCAESAEDPACDFRSAAETGNLVADEARGNACIAACVDAASCEQMKSDSGCFEACASQTCGPFRDSVSYRACLNSDELVECLDETACADPAPPDSDQRLRGEFESCVATCDGFFEPPGCQHSRDCGAGEACFAVEDRPASGQCAPVEGELVEFVVTDPTAFADGCEVADDCMVVVEGFSCACSDNACAATGAILKAREADYLAAFDALKDTCTDGLYCPPYGDGICSPDSQAACVDSACVAVDDGSECVSDADCADSEKLYLEPANARCLSSGNSERLFGLTCAECMYDTRLPDDFWTSPDLPSCPAGYFCHAQGLEANTCQPLTPCESQSDCEGVFYPENANLACVQGLCQPCQTDDDCEGDEVCMADAPAPPGPDESGLWGANDGCLSADTDTECLEWTCSTPCQRDNANKTWTCRD